MTKVNYTICLVVLFAVLYFVAPFMGVSNKYIITLCFIAPFALSYLSYMVLKYGQPSDQAFDEDE